MNRDILWGGSMAIVGIGAFIWGAQDSLFQKTPEPSPTPSMHSQEKPSPSPTPTIAPSERIKNAQNAMNNGNYTYAISLLEEQPPTKETLKIIIESYKEQGLYNDAEDNIKTLLQQENTEENISQYIQILLLKGEAQTAKTLLKKLTTLTADKIFYQLIIAVTENNNNGIKTYAKQLLEYKEYEKIGNMFLDIFTTYESFRDGSPHYLKTMLANALKTLNFHNITITYLKPTLEDHPEYRDAWIVLGNSYLALKKYKVAERMLEKAVSLDPTHPISAYLLGLTLYELGQEEDSIEQVKNAIKNGYTPREKAERYLADTYFALQKYELSLEHYQYILNEGKPTLSDYTKSVYIALKELKSPQLAQSFSENAENTLPNNPAALSLKAWTLLEEGNTDNAKKLLLDLQKKYGDIPQVLLYLAQTYEKTNDYENAFITYEKCFNAAKGSVIGAECRDRYENLRKKVQNES